MNFPIAPPELRPDKSFPFGSGGGMSFSHPTFLQKKYRAATELVTPPVTFAAGNEFMGRIELNGLLNLFDIAYLFAANDAAAESFSLVNLANPGIFNASKTLSPTYNVSGWTFPSAGNFLNTGFDSRWHTGLSGKKWTQNDCSISVWLAAYPSVSGDFCGCTGAGGRILFAKNTATSTYHELVCGDLSLPQTTGTQGAYDLLTVTKEREKKYLYKNGTLISTTTIQSATVNGATVNFQIGNAAQLAYPTAMTMAALFLGGHLSLQDHKNLYSSLMSYKTNIGL
jgi:hypothetical protein